MPVGGFLIQPWCNMWNETITKEERINNRFKETYEQICAENPNRGDQRRVLELAMAPELGFFRAQEQPLPGVPVRRQPPSPKTTSSRGSGGATSRRTASVPHLSRASSSRRSLSQAGLTALDGKSCRSEARDGSQLTSSSRLSASDRTRIRKHVASLVAKEVDPTEA
mmetsp:Transcript_107914/g.191143  ORF Transcript_107914/g.191143 Transcript_107914/m.191143 type:complete len:167 (+) Transcript_107914:78-578(+)